MAKERPVDLSAGDALPIGSRIRLRRIARGIRLSTMARDIGYDRGYLSHVENNKAQPSDELLGKIAQYLGVSAQTLKNAPIAQLAPGYGARGSPPGGGFVPAAPPLPPRPRTLAQRIQRLIAMAHLTEEEAAIVEDCLAETAQAVLALMKAKRRLKGSVVVDEDNEMVDEGDEGSL